MPPAKRIGSDGKARKMPERHSEPEVAAEFDMEEGQKLAKDYGRTVCNIIQRKKCPNVPFGDENSKILEFPLKNSTFWHIREMSRVVSEAAHPHPNLDLNFNRPLPPRGTTRIQTETPWIQPERF